MHAKFLGTTRRRVLSVVAALAAIFGLSFGAASLASAAGASNVLCAKNGSRELTVFSGTCPAGFFRAQLTTSDVAGLGVPAGNVDVAALVKAEVAKQLTTAPAGVHLAQKTVTVNADFQAGTVAERTVTVTGLPAYAAGALEINGSNAGDVTVNGAAIAVTPLPNAGGVTTRKFLVTPTGFDATNSTRSFTLTVWVLAVAP